MSWFKTDDKLAFHPKVIAAGNAAMGLWIRAGAWSRDQQTDGHIPTGMIPALGGKPTDARALVNAGLWEQTTNGYQFHDWHEYQPNGTDLRHSEARGALGAHRRWHRNQPSPGCQFCIADAATSQ